MVWEVSEIDCEIQIGRKQYNYRCEKIIYKGFRID